jgi:DNA-binding GntR family transcriptional regulator
MTFETTEMTSPTTARGRVREDIRRCILAGEFKPGERLTQQLLAKRFGVAQSVVRESLLELQLSGLVRSVDNLGIFVSELDPARLLDAYYVREIFEGLAARLCCERASRADLRELNEMAERIYQLGAAKKERERGSLDRQFHHRMIVISQNSVLAQLTEAYHVLGMVVQAMRPNDEIRAEHLAIVRAIEKNKLDEAERAARAHVAGTRKAIEAQIAQGKFEPRWVVD